MNHRALLSLGLSALVLGGTVVLAGDGATAGTHAGGTPEASAKRASKALAKGDLSAVTLAEAAVAGAPKRVEYRMLLGQSYLKAGRFQSARDAFADALTLQPDNGRAALNLALTQIATGDWGRARQTLDANTAIIPASDRGLAVALAGDPAGAVQLLMAAAREPGADAKVRQNLGLALALAGQWPLARTVAATDMSPADVDRRMMEWAAFAQPVSASDQVAALLGVRAAADSGQPVMLALNAPVAVAPVAVVAPPVPVVAVAAPAPVAGPEPVAVVEPVAPVAVEASPLAVAIKSGVTFGPRLEVVQTLPTPMLRANGPMKVALAPVKLATFKAAAAAVRTPVAARVPDTKPGEWVVQLGAFESAAVARDAWGRISRRHAGFSGQQPRGVAIRTDAGDFYRLSVGGYDRASADGICRRVRARGGACFVRLGAGDRVAQWVRPGIQVASR